MRLIRFLLRFVIGPPVLVAAVACSAAALGAQLGRTSLTWDILTHFAPIWLLGALAGLVLAFAYRGAMRGFAAATSAIGVTASLVLIVPEFTRDTGPRASASAPGQLKVIQFNTWVWNDEVEPTIDWIIAEKPDVVLLQESNRRMRRRLAERTGWHISCRQCDVTIASRAEPSATMRLPGDGPLGTATFRDARGEFTVIGIHNAWPTDAHDQQRQEGRIRRVLGTVSRERAILTGDFNSAPWSFYRRRWDREFGLIRRDRALFTWPAQQPGRLRWLGLFPFLAIDHVYAGSDWATVSVRRGPKLGSDHYPVVMVLAPAARR